MHVKNSSVLKSIPGDQLSEPTMLSFLCFFKKKCSCIGEIKIAHHFSNCFFLCLVLELQIVYLFAIFRWHVNYFSVLL